MKNVVALKDIVKVVESVQAEHRVIQEKLMDLRKVLSLLDPAAAIKLQAGKAMPFAWPRNAGHSCKPK